MTSTIKRYGVFYILILLFGFVLSYLILGDSQENYDKSEIVGYSIMLLASVTVFLAIKEYKTKQNNGNLSFIQGFKIGISVSAIGGLGFGLYNWVYINWLNPNFLSDYMAYSEQQIRDSGLSEAQINQQLAELAEYSDLIQHQGFNVLLMFATVFLIGLLFTVVSALALKTTQK